MKIDCTERSGRAYSKAPLGFLWLAPLAGDRLSELIDLSRFGDLDGAETMTYPNDGIPPFIPGLDADTDGAGWRADWRWAQEVDRGSCRGFVKTRRDS